jgi:putative two-component system response regulator
MTQRLKRDKPLILIVDDDAVTRELFATFLTIEGYAVASASSGTAAIEQARRLLPDVIVTDVLMPGPGGAHTMFVLRNTPETADIPTIVVSGISERVLELMSAAAYLVKPVDRQTLVEAVRKCIYSAASNRA